MRFTRIMSLSLLVAACGTAPDGSDAGNDATPDAGETTTDAGDTTPDAGESTPDAGSPAANPNRVADGTWNLAGADSEKCGLTLQSGATGVSEPLPSTHDFTIRVAALFQGSFQVWLECSVTGDGPAFTCDDWQFNMTQGACTFSASYRNITGTMTATETGADVTITGSMSSGGVGSQCPPNSGACGPSTLAATGTIVKQQ